MAPISPLLILLLLGAVALTALLVDQVKVWFIRRTGAFGEGSRFGASRRVPVS
jgi:hypothetical protein